MCYRSALFAGEFTIPATLWKLQTAEEKIVAGQGAPMRSISGHRADDPVFTWHADHRFAGKPVKDFRDRWAKVTKAAGVPNLYFHDLRRTAARNLRRAGVPETIIMKIGGWRTPDVFRRYAIVDSKDMADAMAKLEASKLENSQSLAENAQEAVQQQETARPN